MTWKQGGHNTGPSGRINVPGSELAESSIDTGDVVDVEAGDATTITHVLIDSKDTTEFLIVAPA